MSNPHGDVTGGKPPVGGWLPPIDLSELQRKVFEAIADELIPEAAGWPAPSEVDVVSFFVRYVAPASMDPAWYPFLGENEVKAKLEGLGEQFVSLSRAQRVDALKSLESDDCSFFSRIRDVVYFGYYSRPEVVRAINRNLEAGRDYRFAPQPYGYADVIDGWDEELLSRARQRGNYKRTDDVTRLSLPDDVPGQRPSGS